MSSIRPRWDLKTKLLFLWHRVPQPTRLRLQRWLGWLNIGARAAMIPMLLLIAALLGMAAVAYIVDGRYRHGIQQFADWGLLPGATGELTPDEIAKYVGGGIGIALVFGTLKSVIESIEPALGFVTSWSKWAALTKPTLLTFLTVAGLTLILVAKPWNNDAEARTIQLTFDTKFAPVATDDGLLRFVVPIADEAGLDAVMRPYDPRNRQVAPDELYAYVLRKLADTLRRCVPSPSDLVDVRVVGFSSSSLWEDVRAQIPSTLQHELTRIVADGRAENDAAAFNLWVAERRAENVLQVLTRELESDSERNIETSRTQFSLTAPPWDSHDAMMRGVRIDDEVLYSLPDLEDGGFLTRRVDVVVHRAGACERVTLEAASR